MIEERTTRGINATTYIKMMAHTAPVNIGVFFGLTGRVITTSSACTSGSQGIGYAYEAIKSGRQTAMVAGGAEDALLAEAESMVDDVTGGAEAFSGLLAEVTEAVRVRAGIVDKPRHREGRPRNARFIRNAPRGARGA